MQNHARKQKVSNVENKLHNSIHSQRVEQQFGCNNNGLRSHHVQTVSPNWVHMQQLFKSRSAACQLARPLAGELKK